MKYAPADQQISKFAKFYFKYDPGTISDFKGISEAAKNAKLQLGPGLDFPLQFAPILKGDTKAGNYRVVEGNSIYYSDPKTWNGASDRKLGFEVTYIVDGAYWTYDKIAAICHFSKSLLYINKIPTMKKTGDAFIEAPIMVIEKLYGAVQSRSTWAVSDVTIGHGDKMIFWDFANKEASDSGLISPSFCPLKTTITFTCLEWTRLQDPTGEVASTNMFIKNLEPKTSALWY